MNIVGKYQIYLYELYKLVENWAFNKLFSGLFCSECKLILLSDNTRTLYLSWNVKKYYILAIDRI